MKFYIKDKGNNMAEAWVEDWERVYCHAKLITNGTKQCLIDEIKTDEKFRKKGIATFLINNLEGIFNEVAPIGVLSDSKGFWDKLGYEDALGEEREF